MHGAINRLGAKYQTANVSHIPSSTITSSSTTPTLTSNNCGGGSNDDNYQRSQTVIDSSTPVLFTTNRGLYLRLTQPDEVIPSITSAQLHSNGYQSYKYRFCDLERWNTNRANAVEFYEKELSGRNLTFQHGTDLDRSKQSMVELNANYPEFEGQKE